MVPIGKQRLMKGQEVGGLDPKGRNYSINFAPLLKFAQAQLAAAPQRDEVQQETVDMNNGPQPGEADQSNAGAADPQSQSQVQPQSQQDPNGAALGQDHQRQQKSDQQLSAESKHKMTYWMKRIHGDPANPTANSYNLPATFSNVGGKIVIEFDFPRYQTFNGEILDIYPTAVAAMEELTSNGFDLANMKPHTGSIRSIDPRNQKTLDWKFVESSEKKEDPNDKNSIPELSAKPPHANVVGRADGNSDSMGTAGLRKEHMVAGMRHAYGVNTLPELMASRKDELVNTLRKIAGGKLGLTQIKTAEAKPATMNEMAEQGKDALIANLQNILKGKR